MEMDNNALERIGAALEICKFGTDPCVNRKCPYYHLEEHGSCIHSLHEDAHQLIKSLSAFKEYFYDLYGTGLEVAGWHLNGELESFDNFYESAMEAEE